MSEKRIRVRRGWGQVDTPMPEEATDIEDHQAELPIPPPRGIYPGSVSDYLRGFRDRQATDRSMVNTSQEVVIEYDLRDRAYMIRIPMLHMMIREDSIERGLRYTEEYARNILLEEIMRHVGGYVRESLQRIRLP